MSFKARMLNRKASHQKNQPDRVIEALALRRGQSVADIGAGGGYFSLRFAEIVGKDGRVYAIDTSPKFLEFIERLAKKEGFENIETINADMDAPNLPDQSVDLIFMRNVCHHLLNRVEYFKGIRKALRSGGRVAIIDYRPEKRHSLLHKRFEHSVHKELLINEMRAAGYIIVEDLNFLLDEYFVIFSLA